MRNCDRDEYVDTVGDAVQIITAHTVIRHHEHTIAKIERCMLRGKQKKKEKKKMMIMGKRWRVCANE